MTFPHDYGQQLFAYLQAWRQILEPLAAMTPGNPYPAAPWGMPAMPPMPPTAPTPAPQPVAPAPADYNQQLFGYLQAWRQYLEQTTSARPGARPTVQPPSWSYPTTPTAAGSPDEERPTGAPRVPIPPPSDTGGRLHRDSLYAAEQSSNSPWPPRKVNLHPASEVGGQVPDDLAAAMPVDRLAGGESRTPRRASRQAAEMARGPQELRSPFFEGGNQLSDLGLEGRVRESVRRTDTAEQAAAVRPSAVPRPAVRSLYRLQ
jgi:hypothetical protein